MARWYYGWNVIGTAMAFQAVSFGLTIYTYGLWVSPLSEEFGASRAEIMIGFTLLSVAMGLMSPFAGRAMDKQSIRTLVMIGTVIMAAGFLLASFAQSVWMFIGIYATFVATGMLLAGPLPASTLAAKWFNGRRGLAIGLSSVGTSIGGLALPLLSAALLVDMGLSWREAHQVLAALVVILLLPPVWLFVANRPEDKGVEPDPQPVTLSGKAQVHTGISYGEILRDRSFWATAMAFGTLTMVFGGAQANLIPYAQDHGMTTSSAASLMSLLAAAGILGKIIYGALADRISHRVLFWSAALVLVFPLLLMMGDPSYLEMVAISMLLGFATGGFLPLLGAIIGRRFGPIAFGQVMGLLGPFTMPLSVIGPPLAGYIHDVTGSYVLAFEIFIGVIVLASVAVAFLDERPRTATVPAAAE
ncbi:MAG: MFS transporter [Alphaproteobacteria bacterium]